MSEDLRTRIAAMTLTEIVDLVGRLTREREDYREKRANEVAAARARAEEAERALRVQNDLALERLAALQQAREVLPPFVTALDGLVFHRAEDGTTTVTGPAVEDFEAWRGFVDALTRVRALAASLGGEPPAAPRRSSPEQT